MTDFLCDFTLIKKNTAGKAFGHVYYTCENRVPGGMKQNISDGQTIRFNRHGKLGAIALTAKDTLTVQKAATYRMSFLVSYSSPYPRTQIGIMVNDQVIAVFGLNNPNPPLISPPTINPLIVPPVTLGLPVKQLKGEFSGFLNEGDTIKLVGIGQPFMIRRAGNFDEVIVNLIVEEVNK